MTRDRHSYPSDEVARTAIPGRPAAEREKDATEEPGAADEPDRGAFADLPFGHRATAPLIDSDELLGLPAEEPPARFALERGAMVGQYELIRPLGRGGMGTVFLARDTRLGRRVAIKFLVHEHPELVERFQAEARITARCRHENIVIIHDIGELAGYSYMALEYIEGLTLRDWLVQRWSPSRPG
ncbi:MAG: protein kinase, partial [Myxococcota bacterium]